MIVREISLAQILQDIFSNCPFLYESFEPYLKGLASLPEPDRLTHKIWHHAYNEHFEPLKEADELLCAARDFMKLSSEDFISRFELHKNTAMLLNDEEAFHDVFAEIRFVLDFRDKGFDKVTKLQRSQDEGVKTAEFTGVYHRQKYAIEVKVVRHEKPNHPHGFQVGSTELGHWHDVASAMLTNNIIHQLQKNEALAQLLATKREFHTDRTLLAVDSKRIIVAIPPDPITDEEIRVALQRVRVEVPEVDHIACKWMVSPPSIRGLIFEPTLKS